MKFLSWPIVITTLLVCNLVFSGYIFWFVQNSSATNEPDGNVIEAKNVDLVGLDGDILKVEDEGQTRNLKVSSQTLVVIAPQTSLTGMSFNISYELLMNYQDFLTDNQIFMLYDTEEELVTYITLPVNAVEGNLKNIGTNTMEFEWNDGNGVLSQTFATSDTFQMLGIDSSGDFSVVDLATANLPMSGLLLFKEQVAIQNLTGNTPAQFITVNLAGVE